MKKSQLLVRITGVCLLFLLLSDLCYSQISFPVNPIAAPVNYNVVKVEKLFWLAGKDTTNAHRYPGALYFRQQPGDTGLILSTGNRCIKVGVTTKALDSVYASGGTLHFPITTGGELTIKITGLPQASINGLPDSLQANNLQRVMERGNISNRELLLDAGSGAGRLRFRTSPAALNLIYSYSSGGASFRPLEIATGGLMVSDRGGSVFDDDGVNALQVNGSGYFKSVVTGVPATAANHLTTRQQVSDTVAAAIKTVSSGFPAVDAILNGDRILTGNNRLYGLTLDSMKLFTVKTSGSGYGFNVASGQASIMTGSGAGLNLNLGATVLSNNVSGNYSSVTLSSGNNTLFGTTLVKADAPSFIATGTGSFAGTVQGIPATAANHLTTLQQVGDSLAMRWQKKIVDSIPQLYALTGTAGDIAFVRDTLRGGTFYYTSSTPTADSGIVFPSPTGRWVRLYDKVDEVHADWWEDNTSALKKSIVFISARGGGVVYLSNRRYKPTGYDISHAMPYNNISIVGTRLPTYNSTCTALEYGSIIEGPFVVKANNFNIRNVGVDMGLNVFNAYGIEGEAFGLAAPNLTTYVPWKKLRVDGLITLCKSPTSPYHSALFECVEDAYLNNVTACFGIHGIIIKGVNVQASALKSYANDLNGLIIKSDTFAIVNKVHIESFQYDSFPPLTVPYTNTECDNGINLLTNNSMGSVSIDKATVSNCSVGMLTYAATPGASLDNIYIGSLQTKNTTFGINMTVPLQRRTHFNAVSISNSSYGAYFASALAVKPVTIGSFFANVGDTAMLVTDSASVVVGNFQTATYKSTGVTRGGAFLTINNDTLHGSISPTGYKIITSGQQRINVSSAGLVDILGNASITGILSVQSSGVPEIKLLKPGTGSGWSTYLSSNAWTLDENFVSNRLTILPTTGNIGIGITAPTSKLHLNGAIALSTRTITANRTLDGTDFTVIANNSGPITVTLPTAASCSGREYTIKKISAASNNVSIQPVGAELLDGTNTAKVLTLQYSSVIIQSNGTSWFIIGGHAAATTY